MKYATHRSFATGPFCLLAIALQLFAVLGLAPLPLIAQQPHFPAANQQNIVRRRWMDKVDKELSTIQRILQLSQEQQTDVRRQATVALAEAIEASGSNPLLTQLPTDAEGLPTSVRKAIMTTARSAASAKRWAILEADLAARAKFRKAIAKRSFLVALDRGVALSSSQQQEIDGLLTQHWQDQWTSLGVLMGFQADLPNIIPALRQLPPQSLSNLLTPAQTEALTAEPPLPFHVLLGRGPQDTDLPNKLARFEADQTRVAQLHARLRIDELVGVGNLTPDQRRRLNAVATAAIAPIVKSRTAALSALQQDPERGFTPEVTQALAPPIGEFLESTKEWKDTLAKIITGEQKQRLAKRIRSRAKLHQQTIFGSLVCGLGQQLGLTGDQHLRLLQMLQTDIDPNQLAGNAGIQQLATIDDDKFQQILDEDQWVGFRNFLTTIRQASNPKRLEANSAAAQPTRK